MIVLSGHCDSCSTNSRTCFWISQPKSLYLQVCGICSSILFTMMLVPSFGIGLLQVGQISTFTLQVLQTMCPTGQAPTGPSLGTRRQTGHSSSPRNCSNPAAAIINLSLTWQLMSEEITILIVYICRFSFCVGR